MQSVEYDKYTLEVFKDIEKAYKYTSVVVNDESEEFDQSFADLFTLFKDHGGCKYRKSYTWKSYNAKAIKRQKKTIVLCFSGGKDSVATALLYQQHGYDVYLYHLRGINQTYHDEWKSAEALADLMGLPLFIDSIKLHGQHDYTEHPMKNMIIASCALQWAIDNNKGIDIAFGNYSTSSVDDDPFRVCGGDDQEMWRAYERIVHRSIPGVKIHTPLHNIDESLEIIGENMELLPHIKSCIGPYRYREYLHKQNAVKFGVGLLPHRCGSCWKDAVEYIYFTDHGQLMYNAGFYKHCLEVLKTTLKREENKRCKSLEEVYEVYFPGRIMSSKYFND